MMKGATLTPVNLKTVVPAATRRFKNTYKDIIQSAVSDLNLTLFRYQSNDGTLLTRYRSQILKQVGDRVQRIYVGADLRSPFDEDGVTPLSPYAAALNDAFIEVTAVTVQRYQTQLKNTLPPDLFERMAQATTSNVIVELLDTLTSGSVDFITPYTWVDARGLQLSDRIWRTSLEARRSIDEVVTRGIRRGLNAREIASQVEKYLQPDITGQTKLPYGTSASYPAMRLARTEIAHAMNEVSLVAIKLNPFYNRVDVVRSGRGDPKCIVCRDHATISISGQRVRPPYQFDDVPSVPIHPHCLCSYSPAGEDADSSEIRTKFEDWEPYANPASGDYFAKLLLGTVLSLQLSRVLSNLNSDVE